MDMAKSLEADRLSSFRAADLEKLTYKCIHVFCMVTLHAR